MKKLLAFLMISSPCIITSLNTISCFSKKETLFQVAKAKIDRFNGSSWKDIIIADENNQASLEKNMAETTPSWESIMNAIGLTDEEKQLVVDISSNDNILDSGKSEAITFKLSLTPNSEITQNIKITATWFNERNSDQVVAQTIEDTINSVKKIAVRGEMLDSNPNNNETKQAILTLIGLNSKQQEYIYNILGNSLMENNYVNLTYEISIPGQTTIINKATNQVGFEKYNKSLEDTYSSEFNDDFKNAKQLALINNKQLVISNIFNKDHGNPVSDINLDFSSKKELSYGCGEGSPTYNYEFNNMLYHSSVCYKFATQYSKLGKPDSNGNYFDIEGGKTIYDSNNPGGDPISSNKFIESNNHLYLVSTYNIIFDISDPTKTINMTEHSIAPKESSDINAFLNAGNNTFYAGADSSIHRGTQNGLYKSTDGSKTYQQIASTKGLNINSIKKTPNGDIFLGTAEQGIWYATKNSDEFKQLQNTDGIKINQESLLIHNGNLYFGEVNGGLWKVSLSDESNQNIEATQIKTDKYIQTDSNVKDIINYLGNSIIILTDKHISYLYEK